ncbi:MAG: caspase family protein [Elusimicrobia bacterium]|nr:caspase family protein [Elusimicrobiota bacterium]
MRHALLPVCAVAFLFLAGCSANPIMVGRPGALLSEPEPDPRAFAAFESDPSEPTFCVASVVGPGETGAWVEQVLAWLKFRDLRPRSQDLSGCAVLLHLGKDGETTFANAWIKAYSAFTGEQLWEARGKGGFGRTVLPGLGRALKLAFQPGRPAFQRLAESKAKALSPVASAPAAPPSVPDIVSDVDEPPSAAAPRVKGHAVIIGISRYRQALPRADFADRDARTMARYAKAVLGYPDENVAVLVDDGASRSDFEKYLERWLPNRVEADDEVFVYFSGHGAPKPSNGDAYLVPFDGDPTYLDETAYSLKRLYSALAKLPAKRITVVLDSCFSGAGGRSVIAQGTRPLVAVASTAVPARITVISAGAAEQVSNSDRRQGHGLFTYFLLKGLKEKGADFKLAFDYLKPEVTKAARRDYNADQEPQWRQGR